MSERALTVKQPWAYLIMAGAKDVENRSWPVPSTLPQHRRCKTCGARESFDARGYSILDCDHPGFSELIPDGPFPFRLWIHAGQSVDTAAIGPLAAELYRDDARRVAPISVLLATAPDRRGVLLGSVTVTGCHHGNECIRTRQTDPYVDSTMQLVYCSPWAQPDQYHWTLADPVPLDEPIPMRGRQRLWTLPADVAVPA